MRKKSFLQSAGGINWYCEQQGEGKDIVLVPSGEGDCESFSTVAGILAHRFKVLTFDTPGFSRSSGPLDPEQISMTNLGAQIAELVNALGIGGSTFYGCSSGATAVLDILLDYPGMAKNAIIHEAAIIDGERSPSARSFLGHLVSLNDTEVVGSCEHIYATFFNENLERWRALGTDYHTRLRKNYVTWVRRYLGNRNRRDYNASDLAGLPIFWSIGGLSPAAAFFSNTKIAFSAKIPIEILMCKHFPQVSIPEELAKYISERAQ